jgi:hypothetical protein
LCFGDSLPLLSSGLEGRSFPLNFGSGIVG